MGSANPERLNKVMAAFLKMKKIDIKTLEQVYKQE